MATPEADPTNAPQSQPSSQPPPESQPQDHPSQESDQQPQAELPQPSEPRQEQQPQSHQQSTQELQPQVEQSQQQGDARAPSSPPLPPKPTSQAPGPRASQFQRVFSETLRRTVARLNYDNFAACYPTLASNAAPALRSVQAQVVDKFEKSCIREFNNITQHRDVVAKLNELEVLIGEAARRRAESSSPTPPPMPHLLPPTTILRAHLAPHLTAHHSQLNARLQTTQAHNAKLRDVIERQRGEIDALLSIAEAACADVDTANRALEEVVDELVDESRAVDAEMADALS